MLPVIKLPMRVEIANQGSNTLSVYPQVGGSIDNGSTNASVTLAAGKSATFEASSLTNWYTVATTASAAGVTVGGSSGQIQYNNSAALGGFTASGDVLINTATGVTTLMGQAAIITPTVTSSQNNWSPSGWLTAGAMTANLIRTTLSTTYVSLTGLVPPSAGTIDGAIVTIENANASVAFMRFQANSGSSSAANQFGFKSDVYLDPGESLVLQYDATASLWRELHTHKWFDANLWGTGYDGTGPQTGSTFSREMHFTDWIVPASQAWPQTGFDVYVNGVLDISSASAAFLTYNGVAGSTAGTQNSVSGGSTTTGTGYLLARPDNGVASGAAQRPTARLARHRTHALHGTPAAATRPAAELAELAGRLATAAAAVVVPARDRLSSRCRYRGTSRSPRSTAKQRAMSATAARPAAAAAAMAPDSAAGAAAREARAECSAFEPAKSGGGRTRPSA